MKTINSIRNTSLALRNGALRVAFLLAVLGVFATTTTIIPVSDAHAQTSSCPFGWADNPRGGCDFCENFGQTAADDASACLCPQGYARNGDNSELIDANQNGSREYLNGVGCVRSTTCTPGQTQFSGSSICYDYDNVLRLLPVSYDHPQYDGINCEGQGGTEFKLVDSGGRVGEFCEFQSVCIVDSTNDIVTPQDRANQPCSSDNANRENPLIGQSFDQCVMRAHPDFDFNEVIPNNAPRCETLFGVGDANNSVGFPDLRENWHVQRGSTINGVFNPFVNDLESRIVLPNRGGASAETIRIGVATAVGLAVLLYAGADANAFHLVPHAEIRHNNGVSYYDYGSRLQFQKDNIEAQWTAARAHNNGVAQDWIYGTEASWTGDVFAASFINESSGPESETSLSLSARQKVGAWTLHSGANADWNVNELNTEWASGMSFGADVVYDKWTITPLAEFSWYNSNNRDNAKFQLNLQHDL